MRTLALSVLLVNRADHVQSSLAPLSGDFVSVLAVDVQRTGAWFSLAIVSREVNRQISVVVRERVRLVVKADLETHLGVVICGPHDIAHFKDRLKSINPPTATVRVLLIVPLCIKPAQAVVTDLYLAMRVKLDGTVTSFSTTRTRGWPHDPKIVS